METTQETPIARAVLAEHSIAALRTLKVSESRQSVILTGQVNSYYHKQLAQEAVRPAARGRQIDNRIQVA
jgi:hypothetical protein